MKTSFSIVSILLVMSCACGAAEAKDEAIKAFCLDVNWKVASDNNPDRLNNFAPLGAWAHLDPVELVQWHKDLGVNAIQTFAVSCNGYAWYKGGKVPEQPGLKHDFLTEVVKLGRKEGMKVFGYYCVGSNTRWGLENPELSYGTPSRPHIPYTKEYISFLCDSIKETLLITDMDGFMIDWFWNPTVDLSGKWGDWSPKWLPCEQQMYKELMGKPFPGKKNVTNADELEFNRRAIDRCWKAIRKTAKSVKSDCIIWLSCSILTHPEIKNSNLLKEIDWLQNEAGDKESIDAVRSQTGEHTQLITTFSGTFFKRNNLTGEDVATYALKENIGIYCYASTGNYDKAFPPVEDYLSMPLDSITNLDVRNIAILARVFNGLPLDK